MKDYEMKYTEQELGQAMAKVAPLENKRMMAICRPTQRRGPDIVLTEDMIRFYMLRLMKTRPLWTLPMLQRQLKVKQCMIKTWLIELRGQKKVIRENGEWKVL
tara:strand:+ start:628 stop:936 length:309 start_codon:yes stop_codon:yes gene_type:complete